MAKTHPRWKREVPRRFLDHRCLRPGRGAQACHRGVEGLQSEGRGAALRCESRRPRLRPAQVSNDRLMAEGHWVFAGGLGSPSSATVIDNRGEEAMFTDGPFLESKEYLAGFWIIEAADLDVALKLAAEGSKACNRKIEVRPFL